MEKKDGKIGAIILVFFIVIVIFVTVVVFYEKNNLENKKLAEETILTSDKKEIEDTANQTKTNNTTASVLDSEILKMAQATIEKYEKLEPFSSETIGAMPYLLYELGFDSKDNLDKLVFGKGPDVYIKTSVKYEDFKNAMLQYITEELFNSNYSHYKNMDGYVGVQSAAAGFPLSTIIKIEIVSKNENEYTFNVKYRDEEEYAHYLEGDIPEADCYYQGKIICKYLDGNLVVSKNLGIVE